MKDYRRPHKLLSSLMGCDISMTSAVTLVALNAMAAAELILGLATNGEAILALAVLTTLLAALPTVLEILSQDDKDDTDH